MELFWAEGGDVNNLPPVQLACSYLQRVGPVRDVVLIYRQLCSVQSRPLALFKYPVCVQAAFFIIIISGL